MIPIPGYTLAAQICEAGDLILYQATRVLDGLPVLLKIPVAPCPTTALLRRLELEYELARDLDPDLIARPLALERYAGTIALVLEQGPDRTLADLLGSPMDIPSFLRIALGITVALAEIHGHELIHKDLKPEHVLLNAAGHVRLTGLGIASRLPRERQPPESPEVIAGTLAYMAPEQTGRMNRSIDSRSDLYALGITFYQMLTGVLPFSAGDPMEWVHCHIARQPEPPSHRVPGLPEPLSEMVMKLLAKTAEDRYQSTAGLDADLRRCLEEWESSGRIDPFAPGEHDVPDRLLIPEKLYGRQSEIETLLSAFDRVVVSGTPQLVLVSGYSGIGKSSVVHELHKALVPLRGLFASGKFDQFKRDIPYATLVQALQTLVRHILGKDESEVAAWLDALQKAVSPNGQLIVSLIPEVELIIGKQPPVEELPPQEARNRFRMVLLRFLGVFARPEHPLALFLDDLQWLDAATLDLIEQLASRQEVRHLLLIGAYRDNEVGPTHPLMRIIEAIRKSGAGALEIVLAPLAVDDVTCLIADSLRCDRERALPIAQLVHEKTGGNPFFTIQFLTALAEEKLLAFDQDAGRWIWDLVRIHAKGYTDNVVDLMVGKLVRLPAETLAVLEQFACLGNVAEIATLCIVHGQSEKALHAALWEAVRSGLVSCVDGNYRFLHDRIQQAAYTLIPEVHRDEVHLRIGRVLLATMTADALVEHLFDVANQFNRGCTQLVDRDERAQVATLNLRAGSKARASSAFSAAAKYFNAGVALLDDEKWATHYNLALELYSRAAEATSLVGDLETSDQLFTAITENAKTALDMVGAYESKINCHVLQGKLQEALDTALEILEKLGMSVPDHPTDDDIARKMEETKSLYADILIEDLINLPKMTDPNKLAITRIVSKAIAAAYIGRPTLWAVFVLTQVSLSIRYGNAIESPYFYVAFAPMHFGPQGDISEGYRFGKLGLALLESTNNILFRSKVLEVIGGHVWHFKQHLRSTLPFLEAGYQSGLEVGDLEYAGYNVFFYCCNSYFAGEELHRLEQVMTTYSEALKGIRAETASRWLGPFFQAAQNLLSPSGDPCQFVGKSFNQEEMLPVLEQTHNAAALAGFYVNRLVLCYLFGKYEQAIESAELAEKNKGGMLGMFTHAVCIFYDSLTRIQIYPYKDTFEQAQILEKVSANQQVMKGLAGSAPMNYLHKFYLVEAERMRLAGEGMAALDYYDKAIALARENGYIQEEALANELTGRFWLEKKREDFGSIQIHKAYQGYTQWQAWAKVKEMEAEYPQLREAPPLTPTATFSTETQDLDLLAVVQASRAISGELSLDNMLKTLMRIVLENAGAQKGYLLLTRKEELTLAAAARVEEQNIVTQVRTDPGLPETMLPASILNYVRRSRDKVLLDDATSPNPYSADEYFSHRRPKSVLCFPITRQTELIGLLYLENDLATYAFTPDRLAVLELLAAQAAISLENALVYQALRESEVKYRSIVDTANEGIWGLGSDTMTTFVNPKLVEMLGYSVEEMIGRPVTDFMFEEDAPDHLEKMENRRQGLSENYERRFSRKDGQTVWTLVSATPIFDDEHHFKGAFAMFTDITERKRAEDALNRLNEKLEQRVQERTAELEEKNRQLERMNKLFVGRELRMIELKEKIRDLEKLVMP